MPTEASLQNTLQKARNTKSIRLIFIGILIVILLALYFFRGKSKGLLLVLIVVALGAFGLEVANYDIDLQRLRDTGSVQESRVEHKNGLSIFGSTCISDNLNCANFTTQAEAQTKYEACAEQIAADNAGSDKEKVKSLDIYGLDGDNDGTVCEHLK